MPRDSQCTAWRSFRRTLLAVSLLGSLVSCATPAALPKPPAISADALLQGPQPSAAQARAHIPSPTEILALDQDMHAFLQRHVDLDTSDYGRLRQLLGGMMQEGYLKLDYDLGATRTAQDTFVSQSGNCLSFTNLFVALARAVDLDVHFQLVDIPPRWHSQDSWVIFDNHINTVLPRLRVDSVYTRDYVVDFNIADYLGNYDRQRISDEHAMALMYNNLAVAQLREGRRALALSLFRKARELHPKLPGLWTNVGVLHARDGALDKAEAALQLALAMQRANPAALSNLAALYKARNEPKKQAAVESRMAYYRDKNPYYYFQRAQQAYQGTDLKSAQDLLQQALRIKADEHQFHYLRALILRQQGKTQPAMRSLELAHEHAEQHPKLQEAYLHKLQQWRASVTRATRQI